MKMITGLRGGAMGVVSGIKGWCLAGAMGGLGRMLASSWTTADVTILLYTGLVGLVLGMMAGAAVGAAYGFAAGAASGRWHGRTPAWWWGLAFLVGASLGWLMVPERPWLGALLGLLLAPLAARISQRDFERIVALQGEGEQGSRGVRE